MKSLFEQYYESPNECPITEKTHRLAVAMQTQCPKVYDGLCMTLLEGVKPFTKVRFPDGRVKEMFMLGSNSFLNLNYHPRLIKTIQESAQKYGVGAGSPPLYSGQTDLHDELEKKLAEFTGKEAAIVFPAGYSGNIGILSALLRPGNCVYEDASNHASLFDGATLSGAKIVPYLHLKPSNLEFQLKNTPENCAGRLIVSDGVFSMEGSLAPVDELVKIKKKYGALLMIDDAHGFWAIGENGRGTGSVFGEMDNVDIFYGTFSKALGNIGGFCAASREIIDYLRLYARSTFFSSAIPPTTIATILESIRIVEEEPEHLANLKRNRDFFQMRLEECGFNTLNSRSAIVPILIGDEEKLGNIQMDLFENGIFSNIGTTPAVAARKCRLRLNCMATHTLDQLDWAVKTIQKVANKYGAP